MASLNFPDGAAILRLILTGYGLPVLGDSVMPMVKQAIRIFVPIRDADQCLENSLLKTNT